MKNSDVFTYPSGRKIYGNAATLKIQAEAGGRDTYMQNERVEAGKEALRQSIPMLQEALQLDITAKKQPKLQAV